MSLKSYMNFIAFVSKNYEQDGIDELDIGKLSSALTSKYDGLHEEQKALGDVDEIREVFVDFQKHLYSVKVA